MSQWQSCLSLEFFSQNSRRKFSTFRRYKGYLYWCVFGMRKVKFVTNRAVWRLGLATWLSLSCELTTWPNWKFCPIMLQLAWLFSSSTCFTRVPPLVTCQAWAKREIHSRGPAWVHTYELFFTLSHTLPLHDSHLNTGFLNAELQANWHRIKPKKWLIKFNLT